jgi:hypothetical protein
MIFQLDVVHNLPTKLPQKRLDVKSLLFSVQASSKSYEHHKNGTLDISGLT